MPGWGTVGLEALAFRVCFLQTWGMGSGFRVRIVALGVGFYFLLVLQFCFCFLCLMELVPSVYALQGLHDSKVLSCRGASGGYMAHM